MDDALDIRPFQVGEAVQVRDKFGVDLKRWARGATSTIPGQQLAQELFHAQVFSYGLGNGGCIPVARADTCVVSAYQGRYIAWVNFDCNVYCLHNLLVSD